MGFEPGGRRPPSGPPLCCDRRTFLEDPPSPSPKVDRGSRPRDGSIHEFNPAGRGGGSREGERASPVRVRFGGKGVFSPGVVSVAVSKEWLGLALPFRGPAGLLSDGGVLGHLETAHGRETEF